MIVDLIGIQTKATLINRIALGIFNESKIRNEKMAANITLLIITTIYSILALWNFIQGRCFSAVCTVNYAAKLGRILKYIGIGFILIGFISIITSIIYLIGNGKAMTISIFLHIFWVSITITLMYKSYLAAVFCHAKVLYYHDFLINYR